MYEAIKTIYKLLEYHLCTVYINILKWYINILDVYIIMYDAIKSIYRLLEHCLGAVFVLINGIINHGLLDILMKNCPV